MDANLEVGQKVFVLPYGYSTGGARRTGRGRDVGITEGEVVKIGRVRATIKIGTWHESAQFDMRNGQECVRDFGRSFETGQQFKEREHRSDLVERITGCGLRFFTGHGQREMPVRKLEALVAILESDDAEWPDPEPQPPCPQCGAPQREKWSGVECSAECGWWYCA